MKTTTSSSSLKLLTSLLVALAIFLVFFAFSSTDDGKAMNSEIVYRRNIQSGVTTIQQVQDFWTPIAVTASDDPAIIFCKLNFLERSKAPHLSVKGSILSCCMFYILHIIVLLSADVQRLCKYVQMWTWKCSL